MIRNGLTLAAALLLAATGCSESKGASAAGTDTGAKQAAGKVKLPEGVKLDEGVAKLLEEAEKAPAAAAAPSGRKPVCDLFTKEELVALVGNSLQDANKMSDHVCDWRAEGEGARSVSMQVFWNGARDYDATVKVVKSSFKDAELKDVSGIGKRAYLHEMKVASSIGVVQLGAADDEHLVAVTLGNQSPGDPANIELAKKLASDLLKRIQ